MRTEIIMGVALVAAFIGGYQFAAALYGEDIAALREDYATRAQSLEVKYREKERGYAQSLVDAWEARDKALARADDLGADLERVRKQAADARSRLSASAGGTCDAERKQLARCADLVERGTELVRRGVELSERTAIDKEAVVKITEAPREALQKPLFPSRIEQNCSVRFFFTTSKNGVFLPSK